MAANDNILHLSPGGLPYKQSTDLTEPLFPLTDLGNSERFVKIHGDDVRYVEQWGRWHIWNGAYWPADLTSGIVRRGKQTVRLIREEAARITTDQHAANETFKHATRSESEAKIRAMLGLAASDSKVVATPDEFDVNPWLLNVPNGTIDLQTGEMREHRREDLLSRSASARWDVRAQAPIWNAALDRWTDGNENLRLFLQRAVGYSITARTGQDVFFFLFGSGRNGKSQFIQAIRHVLGDYARTIRPEALMVVQGGGGIPNELAALVGVRFVSTTEVEEGTRMAESLVKQLTGKDTISVRFMRQEFFQMNPVMHLWIAGNHKPTIRGTDLAIWERVKTIPFTVTIPAEERDPDLGDKLEAEASGILRWMVDGCLMWQREGLNPPAEVNAATADYRKEMDILGEFLSDRCVVEYAASVNATALYESYTDWAKSMGEKQWPQTLFGRKLREREFLHMRTSTFRGWEGLRLKTGDDA